jgi:hypothetical protein
MAMRGVAGAPKERMGSAYPGHLTRRATPRGRTERLQGRRPKAGPPEPPEWPDRPWPPAGSPSRRPGAARRPFRVRSPRPRPVARSSATATPSPGPGRPAPALRRGAPHLGPHRLVQPRRRAPRRTSPRLHLPPWPHPGPLPEPSLELGPHGVKSLDRPGSPPCGPSSSGWSWSPRPLRVAFRSAPGLPRAATERSVA